ncbi:MAG: hypothetical protein [Microviridae sp.]|nr:MAG: hypothetical protein [Microviridae sp.]
MQDVFSRLMWKQTLVRILSSAMQLIVCLQLLIRILHHGGCDVSLILNLYVVCLNGQVRLQLVNYFSYLAIWTEWNRRTCALRPLFSSVGAFLRETAGLPLPSAHLTLY